MLTEHRPEDSGHVDRVRARLFSTSNRNPTPAGSRASGTTAEPDPSGSAPGRRSRSSRRSSPIDRVRERLFGRPKPLLPERYRLLEIIDRGGFGEVHLAMDTTIGRKVAIKLLRYRSSREEDRIKREAEALAQVGHPNVVQIFERDSIVDGVYFLVLEYVEGTRLDEWLSEEPRTLREIFEVFVQAARGLNAVHARGLVHRDVKPANLVVGMDGRCRVLDFGLAKRFTHDTDDELDRVGASGLSELRRRSHSFTTVTDPSLERCDERASIDQTPHSGDSCPADNQRALVVAGRAGAQRCGQPHLDLLLTKHGKFVGTRGYAAPEQVAGEDVDARADVFGFCVSLAEALFGERPPEGVTPVELRRYFGRRRVPRAVRRVLRRGLSMRADMRPEGLGPVIDVLQAQLDKRRTVLRATIAASVVVAAAAVALWPTTLVGEWTSSPAARERIVETQPGLAAQLDAFEQSWLSVAANAYPKYSSSDMLECLRLGRAQFDAFTSELVQLPPSSPAAFVSSAPNRLWFTSLLDPSECTGSRIDVPSRDAIEDLLQSQLSQLDGRYREALELADAAARRDVPELSRLRGAVEAQRGHLQLLLDDPAAWKTLGDAAFANGGDLEFLVEVLSLRVIAGIVLGNAESSPEQFDVALANLGDASERLGDQHQRARAWFHLARALRSGAAEPARTADDFAEARRLFSQGDGGLRQRLNLLYVDLEQAGAASRRGEHQVAAEQASTAIEELGTLLPSDHPFLVRERVDVSLMLENVGASFVPQARQLLRQVIEHAPSGFEATRAEAELLYLDLKDANAGGMAKGNDELYRRSVALEDALLPHLGVPRRDDIALITLAIAKTRLITFRGRPETLDALGLWIQYENDPGRRAEAIHIRETFEKNDQGSDPM